MNIIDMLYNIIYFIHEFISIHGYNYVYYQTLS
jgi:hypothetical protein